MSISFGMSLSLVNFCPTSSNVILRLTTIAKSVIPSPSKYECISNTPGTRIGPGGHDQRLAIKSRKHTRLQVLLLMFSSSQIPSSTEKKEDLDTKKEKYVLTMASYTCNRHHEWHSTLACNVELLNSPIQRRNKRNEVNKGQYIFLNQWIACISRVKGPAQILRPVQTAQIVCQYMPTDIVKFFSSSLSESK